MALVLVRPETEVTIFPQTAVLPCFLLTNHRVVIPCLNHRRLKNELGISFLQMKVPSLLYLSRRERERLEWEGILEICMSNVAPLVLRSVQ